MRTEEFSERTVEVSGWQCKLTSYKIGDVYYCHADNRSPGATLARTKGPTKVDAEQQAIERATEMLSRTRRTAG